MKATLVGPTNTTNETFSANYNVDKEMAETIDKLKSGKYELRIKTEALRPGTIIIVADNKDNEVMIFEEKGKGLNYKPQYGLFNLKHAYTYTARVDELNQDTVNTLVGGSGWKLK